jgi:hypothetical protein
MEKIRIRYNHSGSVTPLAVPTSGLVLGELDVQGGVAALVLVLVGLHHPQQFTIQPQALTTMLCQLRCFFLLSDSFFSFDAAP